MEPIIYNCTISIEFGDSGKFDDEKYQLRLKSDITGLVAKN
jgi:hypothetical protein